MKLLRKDGLSKRAIAKELGISRTSVIRLLRAKGVTGEVVVLAGEVFFEGAE